MKQTLKLSDFDYELPKKQIAQYPLKTRDQSRLCVFDPNSLKITDSNFFALDSFIDPESLILFNDTKVFSSRLSGRVYNKDKKSYKNIQLLAMTMPNTDQWTDCLVKKAKNLSYIQPFSFKCHSSAKKNSDNADDITHPEVLVKRKPNSEFCQFKINAKNHDIIKFFEEFGLVPLPFYIKRAADKDDKSNYQTLYCSQDSKSVAAPTAGLHFSYDLINKLKKCHIELDYLRLHVGAGTFLAVKSHNISYHKMHKEYFKIKKTTMEKIIKYKKANKKIICVGTTTYRALQAMGFMSKFDHNNALDLCNNWLCTDLFIYPKYKNDIYKSWLCSHLITNFHAPCSSLLMMIAALIGYDNQQKLYDHVLKNDYRMLSYGDGCMISLQTMQ